MEMILLLVLITVLCIAGCIIAKKKIIKVLLGIIGTFLATMSIIIGIFYYELNYKIEDVDTSISPDGKYELVLQAVGEPVFFSEADGRVVFKEGKRIVAKCSFDLYDDGGSIRSEVWKVTWKDEAVEILISGDEQNDELIIIFYDGRSEYYQLDTKYGKTKEERE